MLTHLCLVVLLLLLQVAQFGRIGNSHPLGSSRNNDYDNQAALDEAWNNAREYFKPALKSAKDLYDPLAEKTKSAYGELKEKTKSAYGDFKKGVEKQLEKPEVQEFVKNVNGGFHNFTEKAKETYKKVVSGLKDAVDSIPKDDEYTEDGHKRRVYQV